MRLLRNGQIRTTVLCLLRAVPCTSAADPESVRHRVRAYEYSLNLDYDEVIRSAARADFQQP